MKARNLARPRETLRIDDPAIDAARKLSRRDVRAILVVEANGRLAGVLSDTDLLRRLLPGYLEGNQAIARVLDEAASESLYVRLEGRTVGELLSTERDEIPVVDGNDTLVEVAAVMVRARASLVGVVDDERLIGAISIDDLLSSLRPP